MLRTVMAHIRRASWESRIAVAIPLLLALLALPVMLGAFASPGGDPGKPGILGGGYGPPPTTNVHQPPPPTPPTLPVTTRPHPCSPRSPRC
jgi:hypothetical protein